jgi:hypothetical protein
MIFGGHRCPLYDDDAAVTDLARQLTNLTVPTSSRSPNWRVLPCCGGEVMRRLCSVRSSPRDARPESPRGEPDGQGS